MRFPATPGHNVQTSLDLRYQLAASHAVSSAATSKPVDMVVLQPSTGRVLAVVERPGGFDRALQGIFPPGSTFKIVTASALTKKGLRPSTTVQCPPTVNIGGRTFHNFDNEHLGTTSLLNAFAVSCNTTFAMLASQHLTGPALRSMAEEFGFNKKPALGIPAVLGKFSTPHQPVDMAADAFGQGTDLVNPLSQAAEAAAVQNGTWRPPQLVISPAPQQSAQPHKLSSALLNTLRPMMRAVVTSGTAAGVGFPPGVYGKTGTAEYGSGRNPPSHAWFIGYRGNLAFAVLVEGGGSAPTPRHRSPTRSCASSDTGPSRPRGLVPRRVETISPAGEEGPLGAVGRPGDGRVVGGPGLVAAADPAQQVSAGRVEQVVLAEVEPVGERQRRGRGRAPRPRPRTG